MTNQIRIAVPVTNAGQIDNHFGHCESYNVFTISGDKVIVVEDIKSPQGCGCKSNIAQVLTGQGVSVMLAGAIGNGAVNVLNAAGINVVRGCSGNASTNVNQYIAGSIIDSGEVCHQHEDGHDCNH